jgi:hypothetical protein
VVWKPDYVTATDVAAFLRVDDTVDNTEFALWATSASRAIDKKTNRQFGVVPAAVARTYRRTPWLHEEIGLWVLDIDDVQDATGLLVNGVTYATSGAVLLPDNAPFDGVPWTRLGFTAQPSCSTPGGPVSNVITAKFGWTTVPSQVITAAKIQCNRWNGRRDSPFGVAGSPDAGSEIRLLDRLDPDVATSLSGLTRAKRAA